MLQSLQIKNLALVESVRMEFQPGLNVVTGETGAGKSIIIGALNLLLGERADKTMVREGADQCSIEAVFQLTDHKEINRLLQDCGLPPCSDGLLILRRLLSASGNGRQYVNDSPATVQALKTIGELLVDLHGPHDHQSLLNPEFQLYLLDAFASDEKILSAYRAVFEEYHELSNRKAALLSDAKDPEREIDMLKFQVKELEAAALDENDEANILNEQKTLAHAERIIQLSSEIQQALYDADESAFNRLAAVQSAAGELARLMPGAAEWQNEIKSLAARIQELTREISAAAHKIESDSARLERLDNRIALYQKLKNKYGGSAADLAKMLSRFRERLLDLENRSERLALLDAEISRCRAKLDKSGKELGKLRQEAAVRLSKAVQKQLKDLAFAHSSFSVRFTAVEPRSSGMDQVELMFSPNKGETEKSLRQIASSGEMSRVMLALKTILASQDRIPLLVFDEIDENVGGQTAQVVGVKLEELAGYHQVICITHQPQVAARGRAHFAVSKKTVGERTASGVSMLAPEERVDEIARMLGGKNLTSVTLKHAREMLERK